MEEDSKKVLKVIIALVCFGVAGFFGYRTIANKRGPDLGEFKDQNILLMCTDKACGNVFEMNRKELYEYWREHNSNTGLCSKCGKETANRAVKCEKCGDVFLYGSAGKAFADTCPKCGFSKLEQNSTSGTGK